MTPPRPSDTGIAQAEPPAAVLSCAPVLPTAPASEVPSLAPPTSPSEGVLPTDPTLQAPGVALPTGQTVERLRQRADFLKAAQGRKAGTGGFLLQGRPRGDEGAARIGFTASKKIGNAVFRNRAKRRLRALAQEILAPLARVGWDYVLVAKPGATVDRAWPLLQADLAEAIARVHR